MNRVDTVEVVIGYYGHKRRWRLNDMNMTYGYSKMQMRSLLRPLVERDLRPTFLHSRTAEFYRHSRARLLAAPEMKLRRIVRFTDTDFCLLHQITNDNFHVEQGTFRCVMRHRIDFHEIFIVAVNELYRKTHVTFIYSIDFRLWMEFTISRNSCYDLDLYWQHKKLIVIIAVQHLKCDTLYQYCAIYYALWKHESRDYLRDYYYIRISVLKALYFVNLSKSRYSIFDE